LEHHFKRAAKQTFSMMKFSPWTCGLLALAISTTFLGIAHGDNESGENNSPGLKNTVVLIIRHAEKPDFGSGLSAAGEERAQAYVNYFQNFLMDSNRLTLDYLFSAADSKESLRPRLTLEPLSKAMELKMDSRFKNKQFLELAHEIQNQAHGKNILICWHHGEIPQLLRALGADPAKLLPNGKWPDAVFGWLIQLRYDANGHLMESKCINENLLPADANKPAKAAP
jgi:hypothetical protein